MKKERQALYFSMLINVLVAILKLMGGLLYGSYTLIVDAYYTICDFITDIIAFVSAKISKRRANKKFPFGYGRVEYICQMFIGILIFIFGCFIVISSFTQEFKIPNLSIIYIVILVILLKTLSSNYLYQVGKKNRSQILISSAKESFIDCISSMMVLFVILIGQFIPFVDLIGSLLISLLILWEGLNIIVGNIFALVGEDNNDTTIKKEIAKIINKNKEISYSDMALIKNGPYFQANIEIAVIDDMSVKELIKKENKIKKEIKKLKYKIKFIEFNCILK